MSEAAPQSLSAGTVSSESKIPDKIYLVSYPKIVFLYPSLIAAIIAAIITAMNGNEPNKVNNMVSLVFLGLFIANLVVLSFEFPRTTSLTFFFVGVTIFMGFWLWSSATPTCCPGSGMSSQASSPLPTRSFMEFLRSR